MVISLMYRQNGKSNRIQISSYIEYGQLIEENKSDFLLKEMSSINPVFKATQIKYTLILQSLDHSHFFFFQN